MLTVRFPSGVAVQYNAANYLVHGDGEWKLYRTSDTTQAPVAIIQAAAGVMVEFEAPCAVRVAGPTTVEQAARFLLDHESEMRAMGWPESRALVDLKTTLAKFHRQRRTWTR